MQKIISELKLTYGGLLELVVLKMLSKRAYSLGEIFDTLKSAGFRTPMGSLYPLFSEFRKKSFVTSGYEESETGGAMKTYELTDKGRQRLKDLCSDWKRLNHMIHSYPSVF